MLSLRRDGCEGRVVCIISTSDVSLAWPCYAFLKGRCIDSGDCLREAKESDRKYSHHLSLVVDNPEPTYIVFKLTEKLHPACCVHFHVGQICAHPCTSGRGTDDGGILQIRMQPPEYIHFV
jgi:hypothetical protein